MNTMNRGLYIAGNWLRYFWSKRSEIERRVVPWFWLVGCLFLLGFFYNAYSNLYPKYKLVLGIWCALALSALATYYFTWFMHHNGYEYITSLLMDFFSLSSIVALLGVVLMLLGLLFGNKPEVNIGSGLFGIGTMLTVAHIFTGYGEQRP